MDERLRERLAQQLGAGGVILFTGAGFSLGAKSRDGVLLPSVSELKSELWKLAFGTEEMDGSEIGDVFEAALAQAGNNTKRLLRSRLTVDPSTLPAEYETWFSFPWHRIYTLNVDDLADAAARAFDLPRRVKCVSALGDAVPAHTDDLLVVHLNGRLHDVPNVTFSRPQYGDRQAGYDLWYENLVREIAHHPVLFVGTSLNEPPLWQYVEARGRKRGSVELRPGSYLVSPSLPLAKRTALSHFNIEWVPVDRTAFHDQVLETMSEPAKSGLLSLSRQRSLTSAGEANPIVEIGSVSDDFVDDAREFLLGREPRWSDLTRGYAVEREFDRRLAAQLETESPRLVALTGTAGAGKSTSAMRLVLNLAADGRRAALMNPYAFSPLTAIRTAVAVSGAQVLLIDDADRFGAATAGLLHDLSSENPGILVVACMRSARYASLGVDEDLAGRHGVIHASIPLLEDNDIDGLLDALDSANRLGALKGQTRETQHATFAERCGRELLVAMMEATSGVRFDEKIETECKQIEGTARHIYALVAVATNFRIRLTTHEVLSACSVEAPEALSQLRALENAHLIIHTAGGLSLRHRVVAEHAIAYYRSARQLAAPITGLVFSLAASAPTGPLRFSRPGRLLIQLLNHDWLLRVLALRNDSAVDLAQIREVYEVAEDLLRNDPHYWLQRGSLETEEGRIDLAKNFLDQALGLAPEDLFIRTEWAYMTLKRAAHSAGDPEALDQARVAFEELLDIISRQGGANSKPFHVYGSQGLSWAKRAPIDTSARIQLLDELRATVDRGLHHHPGNNELLVLARDLQTEQLMIAVPQQDSSAIP